jgi:hypothetical protein
MPSTRATNRNRQVRFPLVHEAWNEEAEQTFGVLQKGPRLRQALEKGADGSIVSGKVTELVDIVRIRKEAHVERDIGFVRVPEFVPKRDKSHVQGHWFLGSRLLPGLDEPDTMVTRRVLTEGVLYG